MAPKAALEHFASLIPSLDQIDPAKFAETHDAKAFTLAEATDQAMLEKVKGAVQKGLEQGQPRQAVASVQQILDGAGVSPKNPQYAEMVFRTNAMAAYNEGSTKEMQDPDVAESFPVWQYVGVLDGRQGEDHEPNFDNYYSNETDFDDVRGDRIFNCRCTSIPIFVDDWNELQADGAEVSQFHEGETNGSVRVGDGDRRGAHVGRPGAEPYSDRPASTAELRAYLERMCGGPGSGRPGPCPGEGGRPGMAPAPVAFQSPEQLHAAADQVAQKETGLFSRMISAVKNLPVVKQLTQLHSFAQLQAIHLYNGLAARYGTANANAIFAKGVMAGAGGGFSLAVGQKFATVASAGVAEAYRLVTGKHAEADGQVDMALVDREGAKFRAQLEQAFAAHVQQQGQELSEFCEGKACVADELRSRLERFAAGDQSRDEHGRFAAEAMAKAVVLKGKNQKAQGKVAGAIDKALTHASDSPEAAQALQKASMAKERGIHGLARDLLLRASKEASTLPTGHSLKAAISSAISAHDDAEVIRGKAEKAATIAAKAQTADLDAGVKAKQTEQEGHLVEAKAHSASLKKSLAGLPQHDAIDAVRDSAESLPSNIGERRQALAGLSEGLRKTAGQVATGPSLGEHHAAVVGQLRQASLSARRQADALGRYQQAGGEARQLNRTRVQTQDAAAEKMHELRERLERYCGGVGGKPGPCAAPAPGSMKAGAVKAGHVLERPDHPDYNDPHRLAVEEKVHQIEGTRKNAGDVGRTFVPGDMFDNHTAVWTGDTLRSLVSTDSQGRVKVGRNGGSMHAIPEGLAPEESDYRIRTALGAKTSDEHKAKYGKPADWRKRDAGGHTSHGELRSYLEHYCGGKGSGRPGPCPEGKTAGPAAPDHAAEAQQVVRGIRSRLKAGVQKILGGIDSATHGSISLLSAGHPLQAAGQAFNSVFHSVHEEVYEAALSQHSIPGAAIAAKVGSTVATAAQRGLLKSVAWAMGKLAGKHAEAFADDLMQADQSLLDQLTDLAAQELASLGLQPDRARLAGRILAALKGEQPAAMAEVPAAPVAQTTRWSCGPAALASAARSLGLDVTEAQAQQAIGASPDEGAPPEDILAGAKSLGMQAVARERMSLEELEAELQAGHPVIVCMVAAWLPNKQVTDESGHWATVVGAGPEGITLADPAAGEVRLSPEEFVKRWRDEDSEGRPYERFGIAVSAS